MAGCCKGACAICSLVCGILLVIVACITVPVLETALKSQVKGQVLLDKSSNKRFTNWETNPPNAIQGRNIKGYVYNITNPWEVLAGKKPNVTELGPFVYSYGWNRFDLSWEDDDDILKYREWMYWVYEPSMSAYPNDDVVVISPNVAFAAAWATLAKAGMTGLVDFVYTGTDFERLFHTGSARDMFFGYNDPKVWSLHQQLPQLAPALVPGLMGRNTTHEFAHSWKNTDWRKIRTGKKHPDEAYQLVERWGMKMVELCANAGQPQTPCYNESQNSTAWATSAASTVGGSWGTNWGPNIKEDAKLVVWVDPLYRTLTLEKIGEVTKHGIKLWQFGTPASEWSDAKKVPANADYYMFAGDGFMNVSHIQHGVPLFASLPRFKGCDPMYRNALNGMDAPIPGVHDFVIDVEPITGVAMGGAGVSMVSVLLETLEYMGVSGKTKIFPNISSVLMPMAYIADGGAVSASQADEFNNSVGLVLTMKMWTPIVCGTVGGVLLVVGAFLARRSYMKKRSHVSDGLLVDEV